MTQQIDHEMRVCEFMNKAGRDIPLFPEIPDEKTRLLRAKLIHEECMETLDALGVSVSLDLDLSLSGEDEISYTYRATHEPNLVEIVDGCCDIKVVTTGTLLACGVDPEPVQILVDESNLAKFTGDGHKNADGKWVKPSDWQPPDIAQELERQSQGAE